MDRLSLMQDMADDLDDYEPCRAVQPVRFYVLTDEERAKADALADIEAEMPMEAANIFAVERAYEVEFE